MTEREKQRALLHRILLKGFGVNIPLPDLDEYPDKGVELLTLFACQNFAYRNMYADFGMDAVEVAAIKVMDENFSDDVTEIWGEGNTPTIGGVNAGQ